MLVSQSEPSAKGLVPRLACLHASWLCISDMLLSFIAVMLLFLWLLFLLLLLLLFPLVNYCDSSTCLSRGASKDVLCTHCCSQDTEHIATHCTHYTHQILCTQMPSTFRARHVSRYIVISFSPHEDSYSLKKEAGMNNTAWPTVFDMQPL